MNIAVNTRYLMKDELEGYGYFIREVLKQLTRDHPEHQFYFLFDRPYPETYRFSENVIPLIVPPPARHPVLWKYWYDIKVARALKKIKASVFLSPDGFASLTTRVPQYLVVHDLGFLHQPEAYKRSHYLFYKYYQKRFIKKARRVATVSEFSRADICRLYHTDPARIDVVYNGVKDVFRPLDHEAQEAIRSAYTGGKPYFIYAGALQPRKNLVALLKAFSIFKKRQKSEMKLVLAGRLAWKNDAFLDLLKTYKYREDVVLTGYLPEAELAGLMASAYALVYPSLFEGFGVPVIEAMKCGIPALTSAHSAMEEIGGEAALYFDAASPADMAEKLMLIYKDENRRAQLIASGRERAALYTWKRTADLLWEGLTSMLEGLR
ncbi:MAG TPA: glycosyltransferase family 1 protein [Flavisolibacter sp.]|nr:glycosyltransferase family 1 protein [Flavisolibacter sp.]